VSARRRGPALLVGVTLASLLLLLAARGVGRLAWPPAPADREATAPARAGASPAVPDLTFFRALAPTAPGKRPTPVPDAALRPAPGDVLAGGAYIVQVTATGDPGQARRMRDRLASHGIPAVVVEDDGSASPVYRVRVGRWKERAPAEEMAARIRKQEGVEPWVLQESGP